MHEYDYVPAEPDRAIQTEPLLEEAIYLASLGCSGPVRLAGDPIAMHREAPWIVASPDTLCHVMAVRACQAAGFTPRIRHHADDFATVLALVAAGQGVALVPELGVIGPPPGVPAADRRVHRGHPRRGRRDWPRRRDQPSRRGRIGGRVNHVSGGEERDGVTLTNLDQPLFDGAGATKRDLVDYLDAIRGPIIAVLTQRPLSVIRVLRGQDPFMQKNVPKYTPPWVRTVTLWAESSRREVSYALCDDRRTLLWFANQRAIEYHPTLGHADHLDRPSYLVLDIDPPANSFGLAVRAAFLVRQALTDLGLAGAVKTSGAKGVHVLVPIADTGSEDAAAATRAIAARAERLDPELTTTAFIREVRAGKVFLDSPRAGGATVVAAYSPRVRPGTPVSFPVPWDDLDRVSPGDFTVRNAAALVTEQRSWAGLLPEPQRLAADLVAEGHEIPIARVQAMHEGKRRARARRASEET